MSDACHDDEVEGHFVEIYRDFKPLWNHVVVRGNGLCFGSALHAWTADLEPTALGCQRVQSLGNSRSSTSRP